MGVGWRLPRIVRRSFTLTDNCRRRIVVCAEDNIQGSNERKNGKIQVQRRFADKYWHCFSLELENKRRCLPTVSKHMRCHEMLKNEISVRSLTCLIVGFTLALDLQYSWRNKVVQFLIRMYEEKLVFSVTLQSSPCLLQLKS